MKPGKSTGATRHGAALLGAALLATGLMLSTGAHAQSYGGTQGSQSGQGGQGGQGQGQGQGQGGQGGRPHHPPREAIAACESKASGAACSFTGREGETVSGTCFAPPARGTGGGGSGGSAGGGSAGGGSAAGASNAGNGPQGSPPLACRPAHPPMGEGAPPPGGNG
jgi:hypothetical protein